MGEASCTILKPRRGSRDQYRVNGLTFTLVQIVRALSFLFFSYFDRPFHIILASCVARNVVGLASPRLPSPH